MNEQETIDEDARRRFESDWTPEILGQIDRYLPGADDSRYWPTLEELIYIDLEFSWKELSKGSNEETVSEYHSPVSRLKLHSRRFELEQHEELYERLAEFDESLKNKTRNRKDPVVRSFESEVAAQQVELETRLGGGTDTAREKTASDSIEEDVETAKEFGDYYLEQILGRGGMGVVFRAREKKTGRKVAIKMIRSNIVNRVDPTTQRIILERFQKEASAVARIEHPNIVTMYHVGEVRQTPFISMQWVDGEDLATRIRTSVLDGKTAARYMKSVAQAIAAAHGEGILHRDLKPHNILIDSRSDTPLVTDFGLAKLQDEKDGGLTETGELLGTPGYMSPEQARGTPAGPSTDVYSLGATLYCLLGGRAPFQAADSLKTIEQIVKNPPLELREINPDIDPELNTICLKCLEKDPTRRYSTAQELAEDLGRYLEGLPIHARPVSGVEKSIRWCKRNPLPVTIMVATILLLCSVLVGWRWTASVSRKNSANANLGLRYTRTQFREIIEDRLLKAPGIKTIREKLLQNSRNFYEEFVRLNGEDESVKGDVAFARFAIGRIDLDLKGPEAATSSLDEAVQSQQELLKKNVGSEAIRFDLANSLNLRGECLLKMDQTSRAKKDFESALKIRDQLAKESPADLEFQRRLANIHMNLGNLAAYEGDDLWAIEKYLLAEFIRQQILKEKPEDRDLAYDLQYNIAQCQFNTAISLINLDRNKEAHDSAQKSFELFSKLNQERPRIVEVSRNLARAGNVLANTRALLNRDASTVMSTTEKSLRQLNGLYPEEHEFRGMLANSLLDKANYLLRSTQDTERAIVLTKEAIENYEQILKTHPEYRIAHYRALMLKVICHLQRNETGQATNEFQKAKSDFDQLEKQKDPEIELERERFEVIRQTIESLSADV